jgi:hypothetical protein
MKNLSNYIIEKFKINSKNVNNEYSDELKSLLDHFEFDKLYEIDEGRRQKEPYLTKEEGKEIMDKLDDFLIKNNANKDNFKYFIGQGHKFRDKKIAKDFKKHNPTMLWKDSALHYAKDNEKIFKKNSLYFEVSSQQKMIGMYGPFGGSKICQIE